MFEERAGGQHAVLTNQEVRRNAEARLPPFPQFGEQMGGQPSFETGGSRGTLGVN